MNRIQKALIKAGHKDLARELKLVTSKNTINDVKDRALLEDLKDIAVDPKYLKKLDIPQDGEDHFEEILELVINDKKELKKLANDLSYNLNIEKKQSKPDLKEIYSLEYAIKSLVTLVRKAK